MSSPVAKRLSVLVADGDADGLRSKLHELQEKEGEEAVVEVVQTCDFGDRNSKSSLHYAAMRGRATVLRILLETRADPMALDDVGNTPLHFAADLGHARAARVLFDFGAVANVANNFGKTAQRNAEVNSWDAANVREGKECIARMMAGEALPFEDLPAEPARKPAALGVPAALPTQPSEDEPFCCWVKKDVVPKDIGSCLADLGPKVRISETTTAATLGDFGLDGDVVERPSLRELVRRGDFLAVDARLREIRCRGGDEAVIMEVCDTEDDGQDSRVVQSPLHTAAAIGCVPILELLLATRADPNLVCDTGDTPLHVAAGMGHAGAVRTLIDAGANPAQKNNFGRSPQDRAEPDRFDSDELRARKLIARKSIDAGVAPGEGPLVVMGRLGAS